MDRPSPWLAALFVLLAAPAALAEDDFGRTGPYVGVGGTYAYFPDVAESLENDLQRDGFDRVDDVDFDSVTGVRARVGYRFHPHVAGEVELEWLPPEEFDVNGLETGWELESYIATANVRAYPLTGRYQPYVLVGGGAIINHADFDSARRLVVLVGPDLRFHEREEAFAARFGAGVEFYITPNVLFDVGAEYLLPTGGLSDLDHVSFVWGLGLRF